jgi:hypothetical protein
MRISPGICRLVVFYFVATVVGASASAARTIADVPEGREYLRRTVSPAFYQSLVGSPIEGQVTVRGQLAGDRLIGAKVVHSELNGAFDSLALELAQNLQVLGGNVSHPGIARTVLLHVVVYQIADGKLAVSFAHFEQSGAGQMRNHGAAWMAVLKHDGRWTTIEPNWHLPREHRGPRSYAFYAQEPGAPGRLRGTGLAMPVRVVSQMNDRLGN